jgi:pimeloyl-ACP methyl ester carboxylesterase
MTQTPVKTGYAPVNGLNLYYEIHGEGGVPLLLLHGAFSAIGSSFAQLLPALAQNRQVIGVDLQGHGRTADIDRPLNIPNLAEDAAALLAHLGLAQADVFGYSMGAGAALFLALKHPALVRKLAVASVTYNVGGLHPGLLDGLDQIKPEMMHGSPWHTEYLNIAPKPENFAALVEQVKNMNRNIPNVADDDIRGLKLPVLIVIGDSDIVQPEHAVAMFRLLGGGVPGDNMGLPNAQLAILPGTTHVTVVYRPDLLLPVLKAFFDAPMPVAK